MLSSFVMVFNASFSSSLRGSNDCIGKSIIETDE